MLGRMQFAWLRARISSRRGAAALLEEAYSLLYDRRPTPEEVSRLRALGANDEAGLRQTMRRIERASDRQVSKTPFQIRLGSEDVEWFSGPYGDIALDKADVAVSRPVRDGAYEPHMAALFRETIRPGMVVVDVGANIGYFSLMASKLVGPAGKVLAFDPNSENVRLLLMSKARNAALNLEVFPFALGKRLGTVFFSTHIGSNGGLLPDTEEVLGSSQCVVVSMIPLDRVAPERVDFMKLDVEGAEGAVLAGAKEVLDRCRPIMTTEFSPEMLQRVSGVDPREYLNQIFSRGYRISVIEKGEGYTETPIADASTFMADYGSGIRIEDLVCRPSDMIV